MFTIIGGDNQPYGPSTAEEVREWIRQGRADGRTLAQQDGGEWRPLATFAEFADMFGASAAPGVPPPLPGGIPRHPLSLPTTDEILARDFDLDFGGCFNRAWALLQKNFLPVVGISLLVLIATATVGAFIDMLAKPIVGDPFQGLMEGKIEPMKPFPFLIFFISEVVSFGIQSVFTGGLYAYCLKLARGEDATLTDAFSGFKIAPLQLLYFGLTYSFLGFLGVLLCIAPGVYLMIGWSFSIFLIMDRQMDFWSAMMFSMKVVHKHWFLVLGFVLVAGLVKAAGLLVCCVGVLASIPLAALMLTYAYEDIFGPRAR